MRHSRAILAVLILTLVAACAPRGVITLDPAAATIGRVHRIFVSTTRAPNGAGGFDSKRDPAPSYGRYDISVPPSHRLGRIEWPHGQVVPTHDFLTTQAVRFSSATAFSDALRSALHRRPTARREVVVYVHGFNNNFAEGLYRMAQMSDDFDLPGVAVHYSWPSAANPLGYGYDRDSVLFFCDGLIELMAAVKAAGAHRILLVGHSMGALLVMEALRQTAIAERRDLRRLLAGVVLFSPDIDIGVFREQAARIGALPQPFVIFTSRRDRALRLSARLTGQKQRLGNITDVSALAKLRVTVFDVTEFTDSALGHFTPATSPALISILQKLNRIDAAFRSDRSGRIGLLPGAVLTVQNATKIILAPTLNRQR